MSAGNRKSAVKDLRQPGTFLVWQDIDGESDLLGVATNLYRARELGDKNDGNRIEQVEPDQLIDPYATPIALWTRERGRSWEQRGITI